MNIFSHFIVGGVCPGGIDLYLGTNQNHGHAAKIRMKGDFITECIAYSSGPGCLAVQKKRNIRPQPGGQRMQCGPVKGLTARTVIQIGKQRGSVRASAAKSGAEGNIFFQVYGQIRPVAAGCGKGIIGFYNKVARSGEFGCRTAELQRRSLAAWGDMQDVGWLRKRIKERFQLMVAVRARGRDFKMQIDFASGLQACGAL